MTASDHKEGGLGTQNGLTQSHFIEVSEPRQDIDWSPFCVLGVSILLCSTIFIFNFGVVPTVFYFCFSFLLRQIFTVHITLP